MSLSKLFLATALATMIGAAAVTAQEATGTQEHHPGAAEDATAPAAPTTKPMQEAMPGAAELWNADGSRHDVARSGRRP